jgi:Protein of unknown function (DUF2442)
MNVKKVEVLKDYNLLITYNNNEKRIFDMKNYWLWNRGDFLKLHNLENFSKVKPVFDTIQWENGLEIAPEELYDDSVVFSTKTSVM